MNLLFLIRIGPLLLISLLPSCSNVDRPSPPQASPEKSVINLNHFDHLYKEINLAGDTVGIVHIYSEYPDYVYEIEPAEGFTCVDDVARAAIMLCTYYATGNAPAGTLERIERLVKFMLFMQNENGYFNNFIWNDLTINTSYKTTVAELNWWSLRAFWALETALPFLVKKTELTARMKAAIDHLMLNVDQDLGQLEMKTGTMHSLTLPSWLPQKYAADQATVLMLGLLPYLQRTGDPKAENLLNRMATGLLQMQKGDAATYPYGAFLSWGNLWHAWGNGQAYALLKAGKQLGKPEYIQSALQEIDHFYPYMLKNGFAEAFWIEKTADGFIETKRNEFPQIAYGIRPMVWAAVEAYQQTGDQQYKTLADELTAWFFGSNVAKTQMYDPQTGRCYDGISSSVAINKNSGSESTIECLLTLLRIY
ncbi:MAG: hypothetical protein R2828_23280 [Saprospiraceae bacterium]